MVLLTSEAVTLASCATCNALGAISAYLFATSSQPSMSKFAVV